MKKITRREHLKRSSLAIGATILPSYRATAHAEGKTLPPSERINLGCIGVGGRGSKIIPSLCRGGMAVPVAFADVDFEADTGVSKMLNAYPNAKRYSDFRVMLDEMGKDIDAVVIATPDHTHFTAAIAAMALGKHVYVEKPLTHTFEESEILMRAEKKFNVVTQMGNQGHTGVGIDTFSNMVDAGLCDNITKMEAWKTPSLWFMKKHERPGLPLSQDPLPGSLKDYDLWCGPRKQMPFNKLLHPFSWRGFYEYGMGMLGDWGAHIIDYVHDKLDLGLPTQINAVRMEDHNKVYFPISSHLSMQFAARGENRPALELVWKDGAGCRPKVAKPLLQRNKSGKMVKPHLPGAGSLMYGEGSDFAILRRHHGDAPLVISADKDKTDPSLWAAAETEANHFASFINACKGNGKTSSPFSRSGKLSQALALGAIGQFMNTELSFDPETKQFINNDSANQLLNPPCRKEWEPFYKLA